MSSVSQRSIRRSIAKLSYTAISPVHSRAASADSGETCSYTNDIAINRPVSIRALAISSHRLLAARIGGSLHHYEAADCRPRYRSGWIDLHRRRQGILRQSPGTARLLDFENRTDIIARIQTIP